ncbi:hypothetical protein LTR94_034689, partial [Friedmanniomyces endolithicus]
GTHRARRLGRRRFQEPFGRMDHAGRLPPRTPRRPLAVRRGLALPLRRGRQDPAPGSDPETDAGAGKARRRADPRHLEAGRRSGRPEGAHRRRRRRQRAVGAPGRVRRSRARDCAAQDRAPG